jgi:uncharacterized membrane protein
MTERRYFYGGYLLQATALLAVLIPFFRWNNLLEWDFPGHYNAIWYIKTHLLPWPTGWNPYFYCGYPQGMFYPPLAHYLVALLSFPMGIALARTRRCQIEYERHETENELTSSRHPRA